jgi:hypothetical protein
MMDKVFDSPSAMAPEQLVTYRPRGYQLEMLDASMKQNIIVAVCLIPPSYEF